MLSVVICSISPERLKEISKNFETTIGVEYEIIAIDNREKKWPIARAYNEGARQARYPYLFFVHEDVKFHSENWGQVIEKKLQEPDCGVIGFAGSKARFKCYSGWQQDYSWICACMYQRNVTETKLETVCVTLDRPFEEVVVLDGLGLFVRKDVWSQFSFDEEMLTGFHCYDLDFSLQIAASNRYKNYVCSSVQVLIEHFSLGNYNEGWYHETIRMHKQKWDKMLPLIVDGYEISQKKRKRLPEQCLNLFLRNLLKTKCSVADKKTVLMDYFAYPSFSWRHIRHCITHLYRFLIG